ncbi:AraC family transcriptional regulator [Rhodoplanes sp. TEM]|uniref:AraC family transcriptional regulator n=1 Tax=Rhodoplanes tepidamans TaxID=200616 RepID=A0ABT5JHG3_RHOTP|nr:MULTISPECIES: AraC family transcriptional regulator [Rhodoplanes]MDC7788811.1 AraC family transcriptional regulator [Rhodoplanes tepidamans]MDC7983166.1 AraC family transcriptional regulator [Rhodoplanes sp. TEM]MDQ0357624.1 AraC family transcriptional regulator [Rhodoplanes tepidamans]
MSARTSPESHERLIRGRLIAGPRARAWNDVLVQVFARPRVEESVLVPAVPEPLIVWILSGRAVVEERDPGGPWTATTVGTGDFFLTMSQTPYELRWRTTGSEPFEVLHLYLGLSLLHRAATELLGPRHAPPLLRDVSGEHDPVLSALLERLRTELTDASPPSRVFMQGIGQSLAVHLVRRYRAADAPRGRTSSALPAFKLHRVVAAMDAGLAEPFSLARLAREAGLSPFHFSRLFRRATGTSPSQHFIRLRMTEARRLLRETDHSVIEIGMAVGYSSPSRFAQVFRREVGVPPTQYRR